MKAWQVGTLAAAVALTTAGYKGDHAYINDVLTSLRGQPLSKAVDRLGLPDQTLKVGAETVYTWRLGGVYTAGPEAELSCDMKVGVGADEIVSRTSHSGNNGACSVLAKKLRRAG